MDYLAHIQAESDAFLTACLAGSLDDPVPTCPDWTVKWLMGHFGQVQRFHGTHISRGVADPPDGPRPRPPEDDDELVAWCREGTQIVLGNLRAAPWDTPAWNFSRATDDKTLQFWSRRMAHEAAVHRFDAQDARGAAAPIDPDLALDGIAEFLSVFLPNFRDDDDPGGTVVLISAEGRQFHSRWRDDTSSTATIHGSAEDLLLTLWGRKPLDRLQVDGDVALASSILNR